MKEGGEKIGNMREEKARLLVTWTVWPDTAHYSSKLYSSSIKWEEGTASVY